MPENYKITHLTRVLSETQKQESKLTISTSKKGLDLNQVQNGSSAHKLTARCSIVHEISLSFTLLTTEYYLDLMLNFFTHITSVCGGIKEILSALSHETKLTSFSFLAFLKINFFPAVSLST